MPEPKKFARLRGKIIEVYGTFGRFADTLKISKQTLSKKLGGISDITLDEICVWSNLLGISTENVGYYFCAD